MKELSIEQIYNSNYKVYTELINRLEDVKDAIKKQNYGIAMDILCKPYPEFQITASTELKEESEDERIRKELIHYFSDGVEFLSLCSFSREEIIAWLEKQGEQKSAKENRKIIHMKLFKRLFCKHDYEFVRNIYGDEIRYLGWKRSEWKCQKCGKVKYSKKYYE